MIRLLYKIYICFLSITSHDAAKILGIAWYPAKSHQAVFQSVWRELSLRGHEVTAVTTIPLRDPTLKNLTEIDIGSLFEIAPTSHIAKVFSKEKSRWDFVNDAYQHMEELFEALFTNANIKEFLKTSQKFDVIIVEPHYEVVYAFGERFKAPVIGLSSLNVAVEIHDIYANPTHPLISPDITFVLDSSPNDHPFSVRLQSSLLNIWKRILYNWYLLPRADQMAKKYLGNDLPHLREISKKYSSILLNNVNLVTNPPRANVPCVIDINQMHIKPNRSLPKDLQDYLDRSKQGVVYFSLGTNVLSSSLDNRSINEIVQAFSQLPFNILWKWEKDILPPISSNVLIRNFFPQQDLLAHPNIKVFVTQGGLQSIEEALFKTVPMVGIPFIADQPGNVKRLVDLGIAVKVEPSKLTKELLTTAILEVAMNDSYKERIKELKSALEDQPLKGVEKAIWWIEYVIRHKGAKYLKSPATEMTFFHYFLLDVIAVSVVFIGLILYVLYKLVILCRFKPKTKKD